MKMIASRSLLLATAMSMIGACGIVPKKSEISLYSPQIDITPDPVWPQVDAQLVIQRPNAERLTDSSRIVVRPSPGELQVYRGASWSQPAPDMLQDAILRTLQDSNKLAGVTRRGSGIAGSFDLALDIRRFDADYDDGDRPSAVVEVSASLIRNDRNQIAAHRVFRASTPAHGAELGEVSRAFGQSLSQVAGEISGWTLQSMRAAR